MKLAISSLSLLFLLVAGAAYADILRPGTIWCAPGINASGQLEIQCQNIDGDTGGGGGGGGEPDPVNDGIIVLQATYGLNCGAPRGNQTDNLAAACDGAAHCFYTVDYRVIGDPAPGCAKDYMVKYLCKPSTPAHYTRVPTTGNIAELSCL